MADYHVVRHDDAVKFLDRAQSWLVEHEAENNLILSIAAQLVKTPRNDAYFATVESDDGIVGCAFRTPPHKLGVTRMPLDAAGVLARHVTSVFGSTSGVLGPEEVARDVAHAIAAEAGGKIEEAGRSRIYQLAQVIPPPMPPRGKMRAALPGETDLLIAWMEAFARETHHGRDDARTYMQSHLVNRTVFVWDDGGPKASAVWAGITPNGVRVGFVFTPAESRGRGYASAITAAVSRRALDSGYDFCCLYTDLSNPTSNSIYQKIGYTPVCDVVDYSITA
jgi:uncharacterized protein